MYSGCWGGDMAGSAMLEQSKSPVFKLQPPYRKRFTDHLHLNPIAMTRTQLTTSLSIIKRHSPSNRIRIARESCEEHFDLLLILSIWGCFDTHLLTYRSLPCAFLFSLHRAVFPNPNNWQTSTQSTFHLSCNMQSEPLFCDFPQFR